MESSILHVCGGDPLGFDDSWAKKAVFSTYVEVILFKVLLLHFRKGILHVCGGDPIIAELSRQFGLYSPRMWR